jgi:hypothetical protein
VTNPERPHRTHPAVERFLRRNRYHVPARSPARSYSPHCEGTPNVE